MKPIFLSLCCLLSLPSWSQGHPLEKTLWNIRSLNQNGAIVLQKIKYTPAPGSKKDYLAFNEHSRFACNIISLPNCKVSEGGNYKLQGATTILLESTDAAVNTDCPTPFQLSGRYKFSINEDLLVLRALQDENSETEEDAFEAEEEEDEEDTADAAADAVTADEEEEDEAITDAATTDSRPVKAATALPPPSYEMGFAQITSDMMSSGEAAMLQQSILAIHKICGTEIAIQNIGKNSIEDYSDEYLKSYASHIVWNNETRIQNNIVILFDETNARSWIYTGTHNGPLISAAELSQWNTTLNNSLKQQNVFEGLRQVLGLIEKSNRLHCSKIQPGK